MLSRSSQVTSHDGPHSRFSKSPSAQWALMWSALLPTVINTSPSTDRVMITRVAPTIRAAPPGRSFNPKASGNDNPRSEKYRRVHQTIGTPAVSVEMPAKRDSFGSRKVVARPMRRKPTTPRTKSPRPSCGDQRGGKGASPTTNERRLVRTLPRTTVPTTSRASCPRIKPIQRSSNASPRATMAASALAWRASSPIAAATRATSASANQPGVNSERISATSDRPVSRSSAGAR